MPKMSNKDFWIWITNTKSVQKQKCLPVFERLRYCTTAQKKYLLFCLLFVFSNTPIQTDKSTGGGEVSVS